VPQREWIDSAALPERAMVVTFTYTQDIFGAHG
jgi:hypothetical protein